MIIDSHLHVWSDDASRYPFAEGRSPQVEASVELLNREMAEAGVDKGVIVQPINYLYDNRYVAECLKRFPGRFAAVALVNPKAPDAPDQLERLVIEQGFGGMRLHLSREADPTVLADSTQDPLWERVQSLDVCFIVLGNAVELPALEPIIRRFPEVKVVIDHLGRPPADEHAPYPLLGHVLRLAQYPSVFVKVSNMNAISKTEYPHVDTFPIVRKLYDAFGPKRLMWGTDFPFVLRSCGYRRALELVQTHLDFLSEEDKEWILGRTAQRVWRFS